MSIILKKSGTTMNEIKISVDDKNLDTVLTIIKNLKDGLLTNIKVNGGEETRKKNSSQYKPRTNTIIREEESGTHDTTGKYINPSAYKQRLKNKNT